MKIEKIYQNLAGFDAVISVNNSDLFLGRLNNRSKKKLKNSLENDHGIETAGAPITNWEKLPTGDMIIQFTYQKATV